MLVEEEDCRRGICAFDEPIFKREGGNGRMGTQDVDPEVVKADGDSLSTWQRDGDILRHVFHFKYANSEIGAYNVTKVSDSMNFLGRKTPFLAGWATGENRPVNLSANSKTRKVYFVFQILQQKHGQYFCFRIIYVTYPFFS